jgi:hypothetical protein
MIRKFFAVVLDMDKVVVHRDEASLDFDFWSPFRTKLTPLKPVRFVLKAGGQRNDCVYGGAPTVLLASDAFAEELRGSSGIGMFPVRRYV